MNFYVIGKAKDDVEKFFSVIPEEKRPRIISDKDNPSVWDHQSDDPTVIVTEEPRTDTDAKEISLDKPADDLMKDINPEEPISEGDPMASEVVADAQKHEEGLGQESTQPLSFRDRGFKVGNIL